MTIRPTFGLVDYCVFGGTLLLSLLIGVYHACRGKQTNEDLLLGGRNMSILPVAVSIMVSFLSAILILGEAQRQDVVNKSMLVKDVMIRVRVEVLREGQMNVFAVL